MCAKLSQRITKNNHCSQEGELHLKGKIVQRHENDKSGCRSRMCEDKIRNTLKTGKH